MEVPAQGAVASLESVIYLDHHAGTPLAPEARAEMVRALDEGWANPSSVHAAGRRARTLLEEARARVAAAVSARAVDVVFTAGGSEACQLGVEGLARRIERVVTTEIEHPAVARSVERLAARGVEVIRVPVSASAPFDMASVAERLTPSTLVALQWVNHEVGCELPVEAIALRCRSAGARLFVDATQALGKRPVDAAALGADAFAIASHKLGGPSGAGALVLAPGVDLDPLLVGGAQERGRRAGTPGLEALVGFGAAMTTLPRRIAAMESVASIRDALERGLVALGGLPNGAALPRVATCTSVAFPGRRGSILVAALDLEGLCVSSGPACSSGLDQPSPTVAALYPEEPARASSTVRFSLGPETSASEGEQALAAVERVLTRELGRRS